MTREASWSPEAFAIRLWDWIFEAFMMFFLCNVGVWSIFLAGLISSNLTWIRAWVNRQGKDCCAICFPRMPALHVMRNNLAIWIQMLIWKKHSSSEKPVLSFAMEEVFGTFWCMLQALALLVWPLLQLPLLLLATKVSNNSQTFLWILSWWYYLSILWPRRPGLGWVCGGPRLSGSRHALLRGAGEKPKIKALTSAFQFLFADSIDFGSDLIV